VCGDRSRRRLWRCLQGVGCLWTPCLLDRPAPTSRCPLRLLQGKTQEKEYFYGADFSREAVPEAWRRRWRAPQRNDALHLPAANPFISTDFAMQEVHSGKLVQLCWPVLRL
jgi:Middle or third domain of peptidase_M16